MRMVIDAAIIENDRKSLCEPVRLCNEALMNMEKEKAFREGYYACLEHMEKVILNRGINNAYSRN